MIIIAKQSFWTNTKIKAAMRDAFDQFKRKGDAERLKININTGSPIPSNPEDLFAFLYCQIIHF